MPATMAVSMVAVSMVAVSVVAGERMAVSMMAIAMMGGCRIAVSLMAVSMVGGYRIAVSMVIVSTIAVPSVVVSSVAISAVARRPTSLCHVTANKQSRHSNQRENDAIHNISFQGEFYRSDEQNVHLHTLRSVSSGRLLQKKSRTERRTQDAIVPNRCSIELRPRRRLGVRLNDA